MDYICIRVRTYACVEVLTVTAAQEIRGKSSTGQEMSETVGASFIKDFFGRYKAKSQRQFK